MQCGAFYDDKFISSQIDAAVEKAGLQPDPKVYADCTTGWPADAVPVCPKCGGIIKPDVVLYEEGLDDNVVSGAIRAISSADCLIIGGTSLVVYPAASMINYFNGKYLVLINKSATSADSRADLVINDSIGNVLDSIKVRK